MGGSLQSAHHENLEATNLPQCSLREATHEARKFSPTSSFTGFPNLRRECQQHALHRGGEHPRQ
jgi:hypothetical protein